MEKQMIFYKIFLHFANFINYHIGGWKKIAEGKSANLTNSFFIIIIIIQERMNKYLKFMSKQ